MSSKPFRRKDLKHDEFITFTGRATEWLMQRRRRIGWGLLVVALVVSIVASVRFAQQRQEERAAALLAAAMDVYRAPVVPPAPPPAPVPDTTDSGDPEAATDPQGSSSAAAAGTDTGDAEGAAQDPAADATPAPPEIIGLQYPSEAEKYEAARERFRPIVERYGGRPSGRIASFYLGICEEQLGDNEAAKTALMHATDASEPLIAAMALYRLGQLEMQAGDAEAAVEHFDALLEGGSALFPREESLLAKARAQEAAGDARGALGTYQRVVTDFAGSYSAVEAQAKVDELSARLGLDPGIQGG